MQGVSSFKFYKQIINFKNMYSSQIQCIVSITIRLFELKSSQIVLITST